jgi:hypothetical protein
MVDACLAGTYCDAEAGCRPVDIVIAPQCVDGVQSGDETAVDCGGSCGGCADGVACVLNADCMSGYCNPTFVCAVASCTDGVQGGVETGLDCGGPCPACNGESCTDPTGCFSGYCSVAGTCAEPSCSDGVSNGDETGIDCGGSCDDCAGLCATVAEIPISECQALEALYVETVGTGWTDNTDWMVTIGDRVTRRPATSSNLLSIWGL